MQAGAPQSLSIQRKVALAGHGRSFQCTSDTKSRLERKQPCQDAASLLIAPQLAERREVTFVGRCEPGIELDRPPTNHLRLRKLPLEEMRHHQRHIEEERMRIVWR